MHYYFEILHPLTSTLSLSIAADSDEIAISEYGALASKYEMIRNWIKRLNQKRGPRWFRPVKIAPANASGRDLYLAIFRGVLSDEKALLCRSVQDYESQEIADVLEHMRDLTQSIQYVQSFATTESIVRQAISGANPNIVVAETYVENSPKKGGTT